jgi:hypothetical protein
VASAASPAVAIIDAGNVVAIVAGLDAARAWLRSDALAALERPTVRIVRRGAR